MNTNIEIPQKNYREQKWRVKNNVATCLNDENLGCLRTIDVTSEEDLAICSVIIKNMYENQNQFYKVVFKVTPSLMEMIFKEKYAYLIISNPTHPKAKITEYFLSNANNWFVFVEEIKKIAIGKTILLLGGLTLHIGAVAKFPQFEVVDVLDAENNVYLMVLACYYQVPVFSQSHIIEDELDFIHNQLGLSYLDENQERLVLLRNSYSSLLNRYGYFIGLTNKNSDNLLNTIYSWVHPFEINLQMLSDLSDLESDMCNNCLVSLKEVERVFTNILSRSFYCEKRLMPPDAYLNPTNYNYTKNRKRLVDILISKLANQIKVISETWMVPPDDIILDTVIDSMPWATQIEMLANFNKKQSDLMWKYYKECAQLEHGIHFENSLLDEQAPKLDSIFGFLKDLRNICAHSGVLMQSLILPTAAQGIHTLDIHENIIESNKRMNQQDLVAFRKLFGETKGLMKIMKQYHLNTSWIDIDMTDGSWPSLINCLILLPFFASQEVFKKFCKEMWVMIKQLYKKVYHYHKNASWPVDNWKQTCLTYTKNICSYLGIDVLIDEQYLLEQNWD